MVSVQVRRSYRLAVAFAGLLAVMLGTLSPPASAAPSDPLTDAFTHAAATYDVPRDLLVAVGYAETHLDGHRGEPSASGGYGVMHLVSNPTVHALEQAAKLTAQPVETLKSDDAANVAGGAAVLRAHADELGLDATARKDTGKWYAAVAEYGNASSPEVARLYADTVYDLLAKGVTAATPNGTVTVQAQAVTPERGTYAQAPDLNAPRLAAAVDYPGAHWVAASSSNYTVSNRPASNAIDRIVIHVTQGSYAGTISWFQNPAAQVSAHYVVRSSDGDITQMVREKDRAWHARDWNSRSVGIEHEGYVDNASWFTDAMYRASAALTRNIADRYNIPKDRTHIVGHVEVPGNDHTDPGPHWNWTTYMQYVTGGTPPTWSTIVDNGTAGKFTASANWGTSTYSTQRYGADYRFADPVSLSDTSWYRATIPSAGSYRVEAWYPALSGYNSAAPYIVATSAGNTTVYVDQRTGGGSWRSLGTFTLNAGDQNVVGVSRWTSGTGLVIADAVRITRL
ncbi:golvesin C-terminal-like domain-containing protein [Streptosporangium sp. NBC_01756]|uniref:golvesin C-terminal-like domain-containing protein n=1 Tax=Streptosporangium sp. NBC_01756 TaxID=2975950 RepID=UPI002DD99860|nr:N-acetylmuramoyl-L-alanine amidase [Streptosporangium sp. NBC_01756]WSC88625.1 N-acetylmuramoyl-L-alanine amidase [Streptosporangium sp. NBC_01756]